MQTAEAMQERRERILTQAARLLARGDDEAFSVRKLAAAANVSVPTIYNLVGDKSAVLLELCADLVARMETDLAGIDDTRTLEKLEAFVHVATDLDDPAGRDSYRASHMAYDELSRQSAYKADIDEMSRRAASMQTRIVRTGQETGTLRGAIPAEVLGMQIYRSFLMASLEWTFRRITQREYRRRSLLGLYLTLAADAGDNLRDKLTAKIAALEAP